MTLRFYTFYNDPLVIGIIIRYHLIDKMEAVDAFQ